MATEPSQYSVKTGKQRARQRARSITEPGLATPTFSFVQFELAGTTGVDDGRYLVREADDEDADASGVLVIETAGAPAAAPGRFRRRPKPQAVEPGEDAAIVPLTRVTVVPADQLSPEEADRRLDALASDADALEDEVATALAVANRALHAHAVGTQDPSLTQLGRATPLAVRVGYGTGDDLADGRWTRAVEVPTPTHRQRRAEALRPAERVASVLGGREVPDACETLLLRARADLDAGRNREAALQLQVGLDALLAEVGPDAGDEQADDLADVSERTRAVTRIADAALRSAPTAAQVSELGATLDVAERVLRRRRILGAGRD